MPTIFTGDYSITQERRGPICTTRRYTRRHTHTHTHPLKGHNPPSTLAPRPVPRISPLRHDSRTYPAPFQNFDNLISFLNYIPHLILTHTHTSHPLLNPSPSFTEIIRYLHLLSFPLPAPASGHSATYTPQCRPPGTTSFRTLSEYLRPPPLLPTSSGAHQKTYGKAYIIDCKHCPKIWQPSCDL